ncbi:Hypothetical protein, putative [Bodo saltans]|uniref:Uncharacterized protein n=1 Tax=Bodo saltans TaxID=75058 RepID=A0A0S4J8F6_BODSA|nr:Hypothetical protein, putative [Bodo saltans]|eukprot:CUG87536.1 Hypothetical protein, putative [Bodo saltans]
MLLREENSAPTRVFVFISNIPSGLLERDDSSASAAGGAQQLHQKRARDPRYERLRRLLSDHTTGLMQLVHLEDAGSPYALALFADEVDAIAACKVTDIISPLPQDANKPPLTIRLLRTTRRSGADEVYRDTIVIDGVEVSKETLTSTKGLLEAYRGMSVPKWCSHTIEKQDCPLGQLCRRIHKKEFQVTEKRRRVDDDLGGADATLLALNGDAAAASSSSSTRRLLPQTLRGHSWETAMIPESYRVARRFVSVGATVLREAVTELRAATTSAITSSFAQQPAIQQFLATFAAAFPSPAAPSESSSWFVKLENLGSATSSFLAPWDWALHDASVGVPLLQSVAPLPPNGIPTPLERDRFLETLLDAMNRTSNRFVLAANAGEDAVRALGLNMLRALASSPKTFAAITSSSSSHSECRLVLEPWVRIPSVLHESVFMFREGKLRSVLQRRGNVRYCTRDDGKQLAQRILEDPLRAAASAISAQLKQTFHDNEAELQNVSVAVRCVCVPQRHSLSSPSPTAGSVSVDDDRTQQVKVLVTSIAAFGQEADNSAIFLEFDPVEDPTLTSKPIFNFTKHFTYRLFSRDVLQVLAK